MRRADRLFQLVQILRARKRATGVLLAERLGVSVRTVYRDIQDLQTSGIPIVGEAGLGYSLSERIDLPPLLFSRAELVALQFGLRMATQWGDPGLQEAAQGALEKIVGALPRDRRKAADKVPLFAAGSLVQPDWRGPLREAIERRRKVRLGYRDEQGRWSERKVWPLGMVFWGRVWTLTAWCELRESFRDFRLDRCESFAQDDEEYPVMPGRTLIDYWLTLERDNAARVPDEWHANHRDEGAGT